MNKVFLIGNLCRDVEKTETLTGTPVAKMTIAVGRDRPNVEGEKESDFFNVKVFGNQAESCEKYLSKGKKVAVVGRIEIRSFEDKDGNKKSAVEIIANEIEFLTPRERPVLTETDEPLPF